MMRKLIRKMLLGAASVLALGIGGAALDYAADAGNPVDVATMPPATQTSDSSLTGDTLRALRKDDIRWAQVELRDRGLYKGSLDGILGPETKRALGQFQKNNGLGSTASLDAQTWEALTADSGIGEGSSMPPAPERTGGSDLGR
jgi:peptidoglycan hydrolase-like protein with peptidoglycan-binding domain